MKIQSIIVAAVFAAVLSGNNTVRAGDHYVRLSSPPPSPVTVRWPIYKPTSGEVRRIGAINAANWSAYNHACGQYYGRK